MICDETEVIIEEGEITDDDDDEDDDIEAYNVLERPAELINSHRPQISELPSEDESLVSSDSDSDKGISRSAKRLKKKALPIQKAPNKLKKYDVWSRRAQEDLLSETLLSCDVSKIDRSLGIESYDYTKSNRYKNAVAHKKQNSKKRKTNKRTHDDQKNVKLRLGKRDSSTDEDTKCIPRNILALVTDEQSCPEELANDIANKLVEEKSDLISKIVTAIGKAKAIQLFNETKRIEADGGMLIMNGTRRRTPGGVYIFLLKRDADVTAEQQDQIFEEDRNVLKQEKKQRKKEKMKILKAAIRKNKETLPELPSRLELSMRERRETGAAKDPPPSPDTVPDAAAQTDTPRRDTHNYSDDVLDLAVGNDMDMF